MNAPYHKIPNARLGVWGDNLGTIHIFFPNLANDLLNSGQMDQPFTGIFYEKGLRPCIAEILPGVALNWPPDYLTAVSRACEELDTNSIPGRNFRSEMIPPSLLGKFVSKLCQQLELNEIGWAEDFFFVHTVRGLKHATRHPKTQEAVGLAALALDKALKIAHIPLHATSYGSWWIDVGLEFSSKKGECLQWMTEAHNDVVQHALGIDPITAKRITTLGNQKYSRDLEGHLPGVSGCRVETKIQYGGRLGAAYLQLLTTERSAMHVPSRIPDEPVSIFETMGDGYPAYPGPVTFNMDRITTYLDAARTATQVLTNARIEIRLPLKTAKDILMNVDDHPFRKSLLSISRLHWWCVMHG